MEFKDLPYAQAFRDVVRELVNTELKSLRPTASLATVSTINVLAGTCNVIFPGDTVSVPVKMYDVQPTVGGGVGIGDVVQIEGESGKRYVTRVVKGKPLVAAGLLSAINTAPTGSSSNMYIDPVTGIISRSTSSRKYKHNIKDAFPDDFAVMDIRVVTYQSNTPGEEKKTYLGLIAEELGNSRFLMLHNLVTYDSEDNPDSVNYDRVSMVVIPAVQRLITKIGNHTDRLNTDEDKLEDHTTKLANHTDRLNADELSITANTDNLAANSTKLANHTGRLNTDELNITANTTAITQNSTDITANSTAIATANSKALTLKNRVNTLETSLADALARIAVLEAKP